jgi:uncharacterized membrane protein
MRVAAPHGNVMRMDTPLLDMHIAAGAVALLTMLVPLVSRKGGPLHRRAGWLFTVGMGLVCVTALLLSGIRLTSGQTDMERNFSLLLVYIAILTASSLWAGIQVIRFKKRAAGTGWGHAAHAIVLALAGTLAFIYGLVIAQPLFMVFGAIGAVNGLAGVGYWRRRRRRMEWWLAHMANMLAACITATTAFLLADARHVGLPDNSLVLWLGPTVAGVPLIVIWTRYYARRFSGVTLLNRQMLAGAESHGSHQ